MLSLENLVRYMEQYMPLNPRTKLSFSFFSKVTTERFCCKIMNPFYFFCCKKKLEVKIPSREPEDIGVYLGEGTTLYL